MACRNSGLVSALVSAGGYISEKAPSLEAIKNGINHDTLLQPGLGLWCVFFRSMQLTQGWCSKIPKPL